MPCPGEPKNMVSWPSCVRAGPVAFKTERFSGSDQFNHRSPFKGRAPSSAAGRGGNQILSLRKTWTLLVALKMVWQMRRNVGRSKRLKRPWLNCQQRNRNLNPIATRNYVGPASWISLEVSSSQNLQITAWLADISVSTSWDCEPRGIDCWTVELWDSQWVWT